MSAVTEGNIEISASNAYIFTNTSNYDMVVYTTACNQRILLGTQCNSIAPVIIDSNASVVTSLAVGKCNPTATLDVSGTINLTGGAMSVSNAMFTYGVSTFCNTLVTASNLITLAPVSLCNTVTATNNSYFMGRVGINTSNPLDYLTIAASNFSISNYGRTMIFASNNNLGLGTQNPLSLLHVNGDTTIGGNLTLNAPFQTRTLQIIKNTTGIPPNFAAFNAPGVSYNGGSLYVSTPGSNSSDFLAFMTGSNPNSEKMRITGGGAVGIGTQNPGSTLEVNGTVTANNTLSTGNGTGAANFYMNDISGARWWLNTSGFLLTFYNDTGGTFSSKFSIGNNGNVTIGSKLIVGSGGQSIGSSYTGVTPPTNGLITQGNVGIGKSNPAYLLDVAGIINASSLYVGGAPYIGSQWSNVSNNVFLTGSNVGIGTSSPSVPLVVQTNNGTGGFKIVSSSGNAGDQWWLGFGHSGISTDANDRARIGVDIINSGGGRIFFTTGLGGAQTEKMRIDESGKVGIATSSPSYTLDVNGTVNVNKGLTTNNKLLVLYDLGSSDSLATACNFYGFGINGSTLRYQVPAIAQMHQWYGGTTAMMTLSNSLLGIGTTSPTESIHSTNKIYSQVQVLGTSNDSAAVPSFSFKENSNTGMFHPANNMVAFSTGGTERVRINDTGSVGIGTTTPQYTLDVTGQARMNKSSSGWSPGLLLQPPGAYQENCMMFNNAASSTLSTTSTTWLVGTPQNSTSNVNSNIFQIGCSGQSTYSMTLTPSGNIGIGTSTPAQPLTVASTNANVFLLQTSTTNGSCYMQFSNTSSSTAYIGIDGFGLGNFSTGAFMMATWNAFPLLFTTSNQERMRITSAGSIGIGTTTPAYKLEVNGMIGTNLNNICFQPSGGSIGTDGTYGIYWHTSNDSNYAIYRSSGAWTATTYQQLVMSFITGIVLNPGSAFTKSYVDVQGGGLRVTSGNVGIGTTSPTESIHSTNKIYSQVQLLGSSNDSATVPSFSFKENSNTGMFHPLNNMVAFSTNGTERVRIIDNGSVGIGTTTPGYKLDIVGGVNITNGSGNDGVTTGLTITTNVGIDNTTSDSVIIQQNTGCASSRQAISWRSITSGYNYTMARIWSQVGGGYNATMMGFDVADSARNMLTRAVIDVNGNMGIGTISPSYPLHVAGAIYATGDITAFSDARYKTDLVPLTNCLEKITKLNGYTYTRTDYEQLKESKETRHIGLIAQEVRDVFPEAVIYDEKNDRFGVNYGGLVASLVEAMKDMKLRINELEAIVRKN